MLTAPACSESEFISICNRLKSPSAVAKTLSINVRNVEQRMQRLEKTGVRFEVADKRSHRFVPDGNPARLQKDVDHGVVIIGSDAHYIPGQVTVAHRAFLKLISELKPCCVVMNGDAFEGGTISRWPRIGWDKKPTVKDELQACTERLGEIQDVAKGAALVWPLGNHDARFETRLAAEAPEYEGVKGFQLRDHFPEWKPCWSFWINDNTAIKHRLKGGIHATHNNVLWSGMNTITGHLHSLKCTPFSDYKGTRYGVDTGTLAEPYGPQFTDYTEDNPLNWRSGFVVLTYHHGYLLPPELCEVTPFGAIFRGQVVES